MKKPPLIFTEETVRGPDIPRGTRRFSANFPGLGVKHSESGTRTYIFQDRLANGDQTTVTLARVGQIKLLDAWELARQAKLQMLAGEVPNAKRRATIANNLEQLCLDYIRIKLPKLRNPKQIEAALKQDWLGYVKTQKAVRIPTGGWRWEVTYAPGPDQMLRRRPVIHIKKTELLDRLDTIREERGSWAARGAMVAIRAAFAWAVKDQRYGLKYSEAKGLNDESVNLTEDDTRREDDLTDTKIRAIWEAAGQLGVYGTVVKLLFLTGCRREEIGDAKWVEIDGDKLIIPKARYKGKRDHIAPLVPLALQLLNDLPRHEDCPYVFSVSRRRPFRPFSDYTKMKRRLDEISGVSGWQVRDVRRTVRTGLGRLGVPYEIKELAVGHSMKRLIRTYDRHDYFAEKMEALEKWANHLQTIINPPPAVHQASNVIQFRRG